jgi:GntR family transcriptional regulator/MocR family aminotransferase
MSYKLSNDVFVPLTSDLLDNNKAKYEALYDHIKDAIFSGRLKANDKLPSSRYLSKQVGISRNSVLTAYELLFAEGFVESRKGAGTFIADIADLKPLLGKVATSVLTPSNIQISEAGRRVDAFGPSLTNKPTEATSKKAQLFLPAQPAMDFFPFKEWQTAVTKSLRDISTYSEQPAMGVHLLREQIKEFLLLTRGVRCNVDEVMITSGSQQALSIALNLLVNSGDSVLLEEIGFKGIDGALTGLGALQTTLPIDEHGICFNKNDEVCQQAKTLILTPSRSFPLGHTLSLQRRLAILEWAYEKQGWVIEDD